MVQGPIELCALRKNTEGIVALLEHGAIPTQAAVKKLKRLKKLNLSNKRLKKVPRWVKYFSGVERLDLSHNELTYLPTYLGHFSNLKKLLLDANPLESIPAEIRKGKLSGLLSYLRELDKSKGEPWRRVKLLFVGKENVGKTSLLQALQAFMAHSAPSAMHSSTSLAAGSSSSSAIFFSGQLHYTSDSKITVKVSERQSQATTFMRTLSTDGIALGELSTEHYAKRKEISVVAQNTQSKGKSKRRERANVIFQTYDFGGQEVFYPTHQFFLTARSIYLVVFNAAEGEKATASIKYWVNQIRVSTKGLETPILLVGTHIDHPDVDTDALQNLARQLKRQDSNIREVVFVSSATGAGLPELVEKMISIAQRHSFLRAVIPTSYHRFYNAIINMRNGRSSRGNLRAVQSTSDLPAVVSSTEKEGKGDLWSSGGVTTDQPLNFISWDDLDRVARNCGITSSADMHVMVSFFHDVGLLIHFEEAFGGLRDLVIINPQWLASVMKSVVSFSNKWVRNGILNEKQLHWVWLDFPRYLHPLLLRIFERFQIAFKIRIARRLSASEEERAKAEKRTGADIIVPSLLPEECPADALDREWTSYYARAGTHIPHTPRTPPHFIRVLVRYVT
ncbi:serine/threonine kinase [Acanthamoeba castellanii str. Neff]|uniref:non-specific serine/threonine protein kinase n=1 Tax=Acanthamoeba castellanii (strain ATCC 30010 / Neff) TaxID=1257118 RepID=L8GNM0_ACACF|nr:serine/threonine kinase [Acanthamoeba castellanii str. Neff]ELR14650.1 serine/threonine kinase [Acanthamoeba castellanii str. Neff]